MAAIPVVGTRILPMPELALAPRDGDILPHTEYRVTSFNNLADGAVAFDWETHKG